MAHAITDACRPLQMTPTQKSVLMALADSANDAGECWPSIPKLMEWTCFSERSVHGAIKALEDAGIVTADRSNGRHTRYLLTPANAAAPPQELRRRRSCAPAVDAAKPPQEVQSPPQMPQSPPQELRSNRKEPSRTVNKSNRKEARATAPACPDDVDPQTWADWLALRKAKKAPVTETVLNSARAESAKAGMALGDFLAVWCARGSQGLQADWLKPNERAGPARPSASANFRGKSYGSTPIDQLPPDLRDAARAALGND